MKFYKILPFVALTSLSSSCYVQPIYPADNQPQTTDTNPNNSVETINVDEITLAETSVSLHVSETYQLVPTISPSSATNKDNIQYTSSDDSIATVNSTGLITATSIGDATITITCGGKTTTFNVTVVKVDVTSITLDKTSLNLDVGNTETLTPTVLPTNATEKDNVSWTSSDESVATVSDGVVTAVNSGNATITATCDGFSATCIVTTTKVVNGLSLSENNHTLPIDGSFTLTATITPNDADNQDLTWTSSNDSVATVSNGVVSGVSEGSTTITASTNNGLSTTCEINVAQATINLYKGSEATLVEDSLQMQDGETLQLSAKLFVGETEISNPTFTWTSSETTVATINNGLVTSVKEGSADITIKTTIDGKEVELTNALNVNPSTISLQANNETITSATLFLNQTLQLTATITPEAISSNNISWTSSDESIATVSSNGLVTAKAFGNATISARNSKGVSTDLGLTVAPTMSALNYTQYVGAVNETFTLTPTMNANAPETTFTFVSDNEEVATVDENGLVTLIALGDTNITCTSSYDNVQITCTINVIFANQYKITSASINIYAPRTSTDNIYINLGDEAKNLTVQPHFDFAKVEENENFTLTQVSNNGFMVSYSNTNSSLGKSIHVTAKHNGEIVQTFTINVSY